MAGTFRQQLTQQKEQQQQGRLTRTQRVLQKQEIEKVTERNQEIERITAYNKEIDRQNYLNSAQYQIDKYDETITNEKTRLINYQKEHDQKIASYQQQINDAYKRGDSVLASKIDYRMYKYEREFQELYDDQRSVISRYEGSRGKVVGGYTADSVISSVQNKIEYYERQHEAEAQAKIDLASGKYAPLLEKISYKPYYAPITNLTQLNKALTTYNKGVEYKQQLGKWAEKVGFSKLPEYAKEKINPSALAWQRANPTEVLQYDQSGNVTGVESGMFKGIFTKEQYDKKIEETIALQKAEELKQEKLTEEAKVILIQNKFGVFKDPSEQKQTTKWYQKLITGAKALRLTSLLGAGYGDISEKKQEEISAIREQSIVEAFKPQRNIITGSPEIPLFKFFTVPLDKSYEAIKEQNQLNYEAKVYGDKIDELTKITEGLTAEMKQAVEVEGMEVLKNKGLEISEVPTEVTDLKFENGQLVGGTKTTETVLQVTDPAFDRRISQNMLDWEKTRLWETKTTTDKILKVAGLTTLGARIGSTKAIETYLVWKGGTLVIKGALSGATTTYNLLGGGYKLEKAWMTGSGAVKGIASKNVVLSVFKGREGLIVPQVPQTSKFWKYAFTGGVTGLYGYGKYKQFQAYKQTSPYGKELFAIETLGEIGGIEMATGIFSKSYNIARSHAYMWKTKFKEGSTLSRQPDLTEKGFYRENKLLSARMGSKQMEKWYPRRYEGFKWKELETYKPTLKKLMGGKIVGKPFTSLVKKQVADEVEAYYKYGGDVDIYDFGGKLVKTYRSPTLWELQKSSALQRNIISNRGQYIYRGRNVGTGKFTEVKAIEKLSLSDPTFIKRIKAEPFPYDDPSTHYDWITRRNILEYGVGKYKGLPIDIKKYKGMVYTATGERWAFNPNKPFLPENLYDKSGRLVARLKGGVMFGSGKGESLGFERTMGGAEESGVSKTATTPTVYITYLKNVKINKAIGEIKGLTASGRAIKFPKYLKDTGKVGTGNIGLLKREVEETHELNSAIKLRTRIFLKRGLWRVPVIEQVVGSPKELNALIKSSGISAEIIPIGKSSLPSSASSLNKAIYSIIGYSKPSRVSKTSYARSVSEISRLSRISDISRVSPQSRVSRTSRSSASSYTSRVSEIVSEIMSRTSYTSRVRTPKPPRINPLEFGLKGKIKFMSKRKISPEIEALLPDFTARALGIAPKKVKSVEQAMREINRIQTGLTVRTGARMVGYSPIDEKSLLRGIMK